MKASHPRAALVLCFRLPTALLLAAFFLRSVAADDDGSHPHAAGNPVVVPGQPAPAAGGQGADASLAPNLDAEVFDRVHFTNQSASHYFNNRNSTLQSDCFFFPPDPPPLGAELRLFRPAATEIPAPSELMASVNEPFYPVLGTRLAAEDLPRRQQLEIAGYQTAKNELQNELRSKIARLKEADAATQQQELASLASVQAPRIAELETTAARLRTDLLRTGFYGRLAGRGDWNEGRTWHLSSKPGEKPPRDPRQMEFEVVRAAAYYQDGLSSAQRRLLREVAIEMEAGILHGGDPAPKTESAEPFFFSPETARISVPADLPAEVAGRIAAFSAEKASLKAELREAIRKSDAVGADERIRVLAELATTQAPRFAALEELAENIRKGLARVPDMPGPPVPPRLPADVAARISAYRGHKLDLLKALHAELAQPSRSPHNAVPVPETVAAFNREHVAQFADLRAEKDGIRESLAQYVRGDHAVQDRKSIDDLLEEFENSRQKQEVWEKYRDYRVAVLMPGLSPEQRRLLFDAAVEELALPLPGGEIPR